MIELDSDLKSIQEMREAVKRAKEAQSKFAQFSQQKVDHIIKKIAEAAYEQAEYLAKLAVEETKMGVLEHKKIKNELGSMGVYDSIKDGKFIGVIHEDFQKKITEIAYPFGVIAGITPTTNPTSTAIFKTIISLKTQNGIVFSPHPSAAKCTVAALEICHKAAVAAGAPEGLIGWISHPTMEATTQLMKHKGINLILATGGGGLVRAAYSSGKPAYGVGPGNVPVYIDRTANVMKAVQMIVDSKTFDNGTLCSSEQAIVVHNDIKNLAMREIKKNAGYMLSESEKSKVEAIISPTIGKLNPAIVGRSAETIAQMAGISVPLGTRLLIAEENHIGRDVPFSIEKLAPICPLYTVNNEQEARGICISLLNLGGRGHTLSLHTNDENVTERFGLEMPVSRLIVNSYSSIGAAGATTGLMPSLTLGCGSYGGNITSDNITARHLINIKRVAHGIKEVSLPKRTKSSYSQENEQLTTNNIDSIIKQVLNEVNTRMKTIDPIVVSEMVKNVMKQYNKR